MATLVLAGGSRQIWTSSTLLDGGANVLVQTSIRCRAEGLARVRGMLSVINAEGTPAVAANAVVVNGYVVVVVSNTAPAGNTIDWLLDVQRLHSTEQLLPTPAPTSVPILVAPSVAPSPRLRPRRACPSTCARQSAESASSCLRHERWSQAAACANTKG
jgi:hypothetical protein